jgi:hypothetical protein
MAKRQRKGDWVVTGGATGELAHCTRCGQGLRLNMPQLVSVVVAASKAFVKAHSNCQPAQHKEPVPKDPMEWVLGRDTGTSSLTIWSRFTGRPSPHGRYDVPHDPADFGRCYRLLKLFPEWREQLLQVVGMLPAWGPMLREWSRLEILYEAALSSPDESTPASREMYRLMQQLREEGAHA